MRRRFDVLADGVTLAHYSDRYRIAPDGAFGGEPGGLARTWIVRKNGDRTPVASKTSLRLDRGDTLVTETGGGGGYGDPAERTADRLRLDLEAGLATPPMAHAAE